MTKALNVSPSTLCRGERKKTVLEQKDLVCTTKERYAWWDRSPIEEAWDIVTEKKETVFYHSYYPSLAIAMAWTPPCIFVLIHTWLQSFHDVPSPPHINNHPVIPYKMLATSFSPTHFSLLTPLSWTLHQTLTVACWIIVFVFFNLQKLAPESRSP